MAYLCPGMALPVLFLFCTSMLLLQLTRVIYMRVALSYRSACSCNKCQYELQHVCVDMQSEVGSNHNTSASMLLGQQLQHLSHLLPTALQIPLHVHTPTASSLLHTCHTCDMCCSASLQYRWSSSAAVMCQPTVNTGQQGVRSNTRTNVHNTAAATSTPTQFSQQHALHLHSRRW
jgi:hypothetical protein